LSAICVFFFFPIDCFQETVALKICCSVICLSAEVHICHRLSQLTNGNFTLALDSHHFAELLQSHVTPPPELRNRSMMTARFVYLGFPKRIYDAFPMCGYDGSRLDMQAGSSFQCPRCKVRNTQLPTQCRVCGLQLYSSSHIARSHHHMFPVPVFLEINGSEDSSEQSRKKLKLISNSDSTEAGSSQQEEAARCSGCNVSIARAAGDLSSLRTACPKCASVFCVECDIFIHDSLHNCPGCCT
jgi:transcription initiation factor TFIIH subunit 2